MQTRPGSGIPERGVSGYVQKVPLYTASPARLQAARLSPAAIASAEALAEFRAALDVWNRALGQAPMPQPAAYGLRLPPVRPSEIAWRGRP